MSLLLASLTGSETSSVQKGIVLLRALIAPERVAWTASVTACIIAVYFFRGPLGFESPAGYVRDQLGAMYETQHFRIYYRAGSMSAGEIRRVGAEHEFRLGQIMRSFVMPGHRTIVSYLYPSAEEKKRLIGAGGTSIAKPWSGEIHIHRQALDAALKHELVHVVAAPFGVPVLRTALRPALIEGLAMAVEWDWGDRTLHQYAAAMRRSGLSTDVAALMQYTGVAARGPFVSYVLAGSFCRFLIDTYGIRKMTRLYHTGDIEQVYGEEPARLQAAWEQFLDRIPATAADSGIVDALFRSPPIFGKVCARVAAARNRKAGQLLAERDFDAAARLYGETFAETGGYESLSGFVHAALAERRFDAVLAFFDTVVSRSPRPACYLPLSVQFGLAAWAGGDSARAAALLTRLIDADILDVWTEQALLCRYALTEPDNRTALLEYYLSRSADSLRLAALDTMVQDSGRHWLPLYLRGKALIRLQRWDEGVRSLEGIDLGRVNAGLEALRREMMGICLFNLGHFAEARTAFWTSMNYRSDEMWKIRQEEWIDRIEAFGNENF
jgi:hypothetical protein